MDNAQQPPIVREPPVTRKPKRVQKKALLKEALGIWAMSLAASGLFGLVGLFVPLVAENLTALVAAVFLYLPAWAIWRQKKELEDYGLRAAPVGKGLLLFAVVVMVVLPPFFAGHHYWQRLVLGRGLHVSRPQLVRFDRELDDRPTFPLAPDALHVWLEGNRLMIYQSGTASGPVVLTIASATRAAPASELRGLRQAPNGLRFVGSEAHEERPGVIQWPGGHPGGFSLRADGLEAITLQASAPLALGRYSVRQEAPLETRRSPWWWLVMFATQLILVALPEEWFYRGYLQQRFDEAFGLRWHILGADLGWGWLLASVCFALGHLILDARPERLAVFFPSLVFGYMRARTGSVMSSTLFHALSNVWIRALGYLYILSA